MSDETTNPNMSPPCRGGSGLNFVEPSELSTDANEPMHPKYMSNPVPIISARKISNRASNLRRPSIVFVSVLFNTIRLLVPEKVNERLVNQTALVNFSINN